MEWWQQPVAQKCKTVEQVFLREVQATEVEELVNRLHEAGWSDVVYERHATPDESTFTESKYTVSATRTICQCFS